MRRLKIGLLGCGTVGSGFVRLLNKNFSVIRERAETELEITKILVRDLAKKRDGVDRSLLTTRAEEVVGNGADIVVELIGGHEPARTYIRESLASRKHVVTANKAVLSHAGADLLDLAAIHRVRLGFEASVCGAIPIVRVIRDGLIADRIHSIEGVVNGTCNYVLTRMSHAGVSYEAALQDAQRQGFAEADPTLDVSGEDAAQKMTILAQLAFGRCEVRWTRREGITGINADDHAAAADRDCVIRHVACARRTADGVELEVGARLLPHHHPLARVNGEMNGVLLDTDAAGELVMYGPGAGSLPSASSVLADVVEIAKSQ